MKVIHLWTGVSFHESGYIVANRKGLEALKAHIHCVLENGGPETIEASTDDGEGYDLTIIMAKDNDPIALPYTEDYAKEHRENAIYPWDV